MSRGVGAGSTLHVFRVEVFTDLRTVFSETGSKDASGFPVKRLPQDSIEDCGPN